MKVSEISVVGWLPSNLIASLTSLYSEVAIYMHRIAGDYPNDCPDDYRAVIIKRCLLDRVNVI